MRGLALAILLSGCSCGSVLHLCPVKLDLPADGLPPGDYLLTLDFADDAAEARECTFGMVDPVASDDPWSDFELANQDKALWCPYLSYQTMGDASDRVWAGVTGAPAAAEIAVVLVGLDDDLVYLDRTWAPQWAMCADGRCTGGPHTRPSPNACSDLVEVGGESAGFKDQSRADRRGFGISGPRRWGSRGPT